MTVSYALKGARDNPQMECFIGFKTQSRSLLIDPQTIEQVRAVVAERMDYCDHTRSHSTIGYEAPMTQITSSQQRP